MHFDEHILDNFFDQMVCSIGFIFHGTHAFRGFCFHIHFKNNEEAYLQESLLVLRVLNVGCSKVNNAPHDWIFLGVVDIDIRTTYNLVIDK